MNEAKGDSARAREMAQALRKQSERQLKAVTDETHEKTKAAMMSALELMVDEPEDTKLRRLKICAEHEGLTVPSKRAPARNTDDLPTKPSPRALAESRTEPTYPPSPLAQEVGEGAADWLAALSEPPWTSPKVLVIDDDKDIRATLRDMLAIEGFRVWQAENGLEGLERLFQMPMPGPDLILLDVIMPKVSGTDFLRVFDKTQFSDVPIVIISAGSKPRDFDDGRFVFMSKPLDLEHILRVVREGVEEGRKRRRV